MGCVFCSILQGTAPASLVYEDDAAVAFMDIRPVRPGQVVIIPRRHVDHFSDLPHESAARIFSLGQRLARAIRNALDPRRVGMVIHGFGVAHAHLIVIPLEHPWDITTAEAAFIENGQVRFSPDRIAPATRPDLDRLATLLRSTM